MNSGCKRIAKQLQGLLYSGIVDFRALAIDERDVPFTDNLLDPEQAALTVASYKSVEMYIKLLQANRK